MVSKNNKRTKKDTEETEKPTKKDHKHKSQKTHEESKIEHFSEDDSFENEKLKDKTAKPQTSIDQINSVNVSGIKKIKRTHKETEKNAFKNKSKEEKLKLLEKLHPF